MLLQLILEHWPFVALGICAFYLRPYFNDASPQRRRTGHGEVDHEKSKAAVDTQILEPPRLKPRLPIIGHVIDILGGNGNAYALIASASTPSPIFTLQMVTESLTYIRPGPLLSAAARRTSSLSRSGIFIYAYGRALGFGKATRDLLAGMPQKDDGRGGKDTFAAALLREVDGELVAAPSMREYAATFDATFDAALADLLPPPFSRTGGGARVVVTMGTWLFASFGGSIGRTFWGRGPSSSQSPWSDPAFLSHLRAFFGDVLQLLNPLAALVRPDLAASRSAVRDTLCAAFGPDARKKDAASSTSRMFERVHGLCASAALDASTAHEVMLALGLNMIPNATAAATWVVRHLLADDALLAAVRRELDSFADTTGGGRRHGSGVVRLDLAALEAACPTLLAAWYESLRCHANFPLGRLATADTTVSAPGEGSYLLRAGSLVLAPLQLHHLDEAVWGADAAEFRAARWLVATPDGGLAVDASLRRRLKAFGGLGALCPGRFLAMHMVVAAVARLLLECDMRAVGGEDDDAGRDVEEAGTVAIGVVAPKRDIEVELRRREGGVRVAFGFEAVGQTW